MNIITLDFESFYSKEHSLTKLTYDAYINSDKFEVIGVGAQIFDGEPKWFSGDYEQTKRALESLDLENNAVVMHNAMFDAAILAFHYGIYPKVIFDTLSMGRALHNANVGNSLKKLAEYYGIGVKGEEVHQFIGYNRKYFTEQELDSYAAYCKQDVNLTWQLFNKMKPHFNTTELKLIDMTIKMYTQPALQYDRDVLVVHLADVQARQQKFLDDLNLTATDLRSNQKFADLLRAQGVEPPMKLNSKGVETYALAKTDEGLKELLAHDNPNVQALVSARLGVKTSIESTRTQNLIDTGDRCEGTIPIGLLYYGARSGRWSATQSLNLQNLPRTSEIKRGLVAPPNHVIVGLDLSNIELRVGLWLAGQMDKLQLLQDGVDLYKDFAANVFNAPYDEVTKDQRFIGKTSQLSLIYGVGAGKLQAAVKAGSGTDMGEVEAKRIVSLYREEYHHVAALWDAGKQALTAMVNDTVMPFGYNELCFVEGIKGIKLPSGLYLQYPNLRQQLNSIGKKEWVYDKSARLIDRLYGAKIMQNCIAEGTPVLTDRGWVNIEDVQLTDMVHDGLNWVRHKGVVFQSVQPCVIVDGVYMTPDHEVLTDDGWKTALENPRPYRPNIWGVTRNKRITQRWKETLLGIFMSVWERSCKRREQSNQRGKTWGNPQLWVHDAPVNVTTRETAWDVKATPIQRMGQYEAAMLKSKSQGIQKLWRAWNNCMREVDGIRELLRGCWGKLPERIMFRQSRQQWKLRTHELSMGNILTANAEHAQHCTFSEYTRNISEDRHISVNAVLPHKTRGTYRQVRGETRCVKKVYDILDVGELNRFVVQGKEAPFIVHNCTQALARCVIGEAMVRIGKRYPINLTVHDAVYSIVHESQAQAAYDYMLDELTKAPAWLPGIVLAAEGSWGKSMKDV